MKRSSTLTMIVCMGMAALYSCKKSDSASSPKDMLVGRWIDNDSSLTYKDYDVIKSDGTGINTRINGSATHQYIFSWTLNDKALTFATTSGPTGGVCNLEGSYTLESISSSSMTLVYANPSNPFTSVFTKQ